MHEALRRMPSIAALLVVISCVLAGVLLPRGYHAGWILARLSAPPADLAFAGQHIGALSHHLVYEPEIQERIDRTEQRQSAIVDVVGAALQVAPALLLVLGLGVRLKRRELGEELLRYAVVLAAAYGLFGLLTSRLLMGSFLEGGLVCLLLAGQVLPLLLLSRAGVRMSGARGPTLVLRGASTLAGLAAGFGALHLALRLIA